MTWPAPINEDLRAPRRDLDLRSYRVAGALLGADDVVDSLARFVPAQGVTADQLQQAVKARAVAKKAARQLIMEPSRG